MSKSESVSLAGLFLHTSPLRCFSTLRHIKARLKEPSSELVNGNRVSPPFSGLLVELGRFPAQNVLESVMITISAVTNDRLAILKNDLHSLVNFFASGSFPALEEVNLEVNWYGSCSYIESLPFNDLDSDSSIIADPGYLTHPMTWDLKKPYLGFRLSFHFNW